MELKVAGQTLSGDFSFEKEANGDVRGSVKNGALIIKSGDKKLIDLSQISGGFEIVVKDPMERFGWEVQHLRCLEWT